MDNVHKEPGEAGNSNPSDHNKVDVTVTYNGLPKSLEVNLHQALNAVLQHALQLFGVTADASSFRLLVEATGVELNLNQSAGDAGLSAGTRLLLAPRVVSGGQ